MLVLARFKDQAIRIGDDIIINLSEICETAKGTYAKIGIIAPDNIPVHREEIYQKIKREGGKFKLSAAQRTAAARPISAH